MSRVALAPDTDRKGRIVSIASGDGKLYLIPAQWFHAKNKTLALVFAYQSRGISTSIAQLTVQLAKKSDT
jgi:hypothetical protein